MSKELHTCDNCEKPFNESFDFCPHCGQKSNDELTIGVLFYNTIANYFSFDARFLRSFIPLIFKPGYLPKKFVGGKRLIFIHPAQVYLFIAVVFFFLFSFNVRESRDSIDRAMKSETVNKRSDRYKENINMVLSDSVMMDSIFNEVKATIPVEDTLQLAEIQDKENWQTNFGFDEKKVDSLIAVGESDDKIYKAMGMNDDAGYFTRKFYTQMLKFYKDRGLGAIYQTLIDSIPIAMFFLLPIFAFLLKLFYLRKGIYAHHLVFSFYFFSFIFVVFSFIVVVNWIIDIPGWIDWLIALSTFFYLLVAVKKYYEESWFISYLKSSMVTFLFSIVVALASVILGLFAFMFY